MLMVCTTFTVWRFLYNAYVDIKNEYIQQSVPHMIY